VSSRFLTSNLSHRVLFGTNMRKSFPGVPTKSLERGQSSTELGSKMLG